MMMSSVDKVEARKQEAAAKRKEAALNAQQRKRDKEEQMEKMLMERQEESNLFELEQNLDECALEAENLPAQDENAARALVGALLRERLGELAHLVERFLERPRLKRNTMGVQNTAKASLRYFLVHLFISSSAGFFSFLGVEYRKGQLL